MKIALKNARTRDRGPQATIRYLSHDRHGTLLDQWDMPAIILTVQAAGYAVLLGGLLVTLYMGVFGLFLVAR